MRRGRRTVGALALVLGVFIGMTAVGAAPATTTLTGRLRVTAHDTRDGRTIVKYQLETSGGTKILKLPAVPALVTRKQRKTVKRALKAAADQLVTINAKARNDGAFAVLQVTPITVPPTPPEPAALTPKPKRVAFVIVHWNGVGWNNVLDADAVRAWALTDPTSLASFYRTSTNNVIQISGDVRTVTLPGGADAANECVPYAAAIKGAEATLGSQLAGYNHVMFLPQYVGTGPCATIGLGGVGGRYTALSGNWVKDREHFVHVASHELGHNLGLMHAGAVTCGGAPNDACLADDVDNYGDPWDAMGNRFPPAQFSAVHKRALGALAPGAVSVAAPGTRTYWLYSSDAPGLGGPRLLQIPRGATGQLYNLEIRGPSAPWGPYAPSNAVANGVSIRLTDADGTTVTDGDSSVLIDATPETATTYDAPLPAGRTFADPAGVRITVNFTAAPWALVTVTR